MVATQLKNPLPRTIIDQGSCCHHWLIEEAAGATSRGICKRCGLAREFHNVFEEAIKEEHRFGIASPASAKTVA